MKPSKILRKSLGEFITAPARLAQTTFLHAGSAEDRILTESDAPTILEELAEARNSASLLGLMLNIKPVEVETIQVMYQNPKERLCRIILAFLRQAESRPTWRAIVNALNSRTINLPVLAKRVEQVHISGHIQLHGHPGESANTHELSFPVYTFLYIHQPLVRAYLNFQQQNHLLL